MGTIPVIRWPRRVLAVAAHALSAGEEWIEWRRRESARKSVLGADEMVTWGILGMLLVGTRARVHGCHLYGHGVGRSRRKPEPDLDYHKGRCQ